MSGSFNAQNSPQRATADAGIDSSRDAWGHRPENNNGLNDRNNNNNNDNNNNNNNNQNNNSNNNNNNGGNEDDIDSIWKDIKKENSQPTNQQQQNQQPDQRTAEDKVKDYLKSQGLEGFSLTDEDKTAIGNGDFGTLVGKINAYVQNSHVKGMQNVNTLMEARMSKMVEDAVAKSKSAFEGDKLVSQMQIKLPWTKDPIVGPVAQTILQRFIDKGASMDEAISGVQKYYDRVDEKRGVVKVNNNRNGNFQSARQEEGSGDMNWVDLLRGKRE